MKTANENSVSDKIQKNLLLSANQKAGTGASEKLISGKQ
jgi:hypothetical protein